jgi:sRNA-binding protein
MSTNRKLAPGEYHEIRAKFVEAFPAVFPPRGEAPKPLAIGVSKNIIASDALDIARWRQRMFLRIWTGRVEYLDALAKGGSRYALDGTPQGEITDAQRKDAEEKAILKKERIAARQKLKATKARIRVRSRSEVAA